MCILTIYILYIKCMVCVQVEHDGLRACTHDARQLGQRRKAAIEDGRQDRQDKAKGRHADRLLTACLLLGCWRLTAWC